MSRPEGLILVVEDNDYNIDVVTEMIEILGHTVGGGGHFEFVARARRVLDVITAMIGRV
jgi:CheY-like chemotaxis protein